VIAGRTECDKQSLEQGEDKRHCRFESTAKGKFHEVGRGRT
jgi:hypothetical protein